MYKVGDRVEYVGEIHGCKQQYAGVLEIWEIAKFRLDGYACLTADRRRITSWIEGKDLRLVEKAKIK